MKPSIILLLMSLLFGCSKNDVKPPTELFTNTDLESGITTPTPWWYNPNGTGASFTWTNQVAYSGTRSLQINSDSDLSTVVYWGQSVTQNIPVERNLTLNVRVKGNVTGAGVAVAIACLNATSNVKAQQFSTTQGSSTITGNFDWTSYTVSLSGVHSDITEIRVYLLLLPNAKGQVYFDDVTLTAH